MKRVLGSFGLGVVSRGSGQVSALVVSIVAARVLGPHGFGIYAIASVLVVIAQQVLWGGVYDFVVKSRQADADIDTPFWINMMIGVAGTAVIAVAAWPLSRLTELPGVMVLMLALGAIHDSGGLGRLVGSGVAARGEAADVLRAQHGGGGHRLRRRADLFLGRRRRVVLRRLPLHAACDGGRAQYGDRAAAAAGSLRPWRRAYGAEICQPDQRQPDRQPGRGVCAGFAAGISSRVRRRPRPIGSPTASWSVVSDMFFGPDCQAGLGVPGGPSGGRGGAGPDLRGGCCKSWR